MGCRLLGTLFGVDGELLERQYRNHLSGYLCWEQLPHAEEWLLFEKNIGVYVGLDEVCLSRGELYTVLINKERKGRSGSLIAVVKGTDVKTVTSVLLRLSRRRRFQVREITMDMAPNMEQIARLCFPPHAASQTVSMCRNSLMRRFRICALKHVGRLWTKNPFRSPMPKPAGRYIMRRSLKTVIHANSFFREAFTCYIRRNPCGRNHSAYAPASCSGSIPILRKHTTSP